MRQSALQVILLALFCCGLGMISCGAEVMVPEVVPSESVVAQQTVSPLFATDFASNNGLWELQVQLPNVIQFGVPTGAAPDSAVAALVVAGDPAFGPQHKVGPGFATQISTVEPLGYGVYRTRVKPAACASGEELVNGIFVYANDGTTDANHNGMIDNNEIDIEILCGEPQLLWMTIWTDYDEVAGFRKVSRVIDFETGNAYQTKAGKEGTYEIGSTPVATLDAAKRPDFSLTADFLEMGFEWRADTIRYFIVLDGVNVTLWTCTDSTLIPQPPAAFMLNLWHTDAHWWSGGNADYPAHDATLQADWFEYWE